MHLQLFFSKFPISLKTRIIWLLKNLYFASYTRLRFFQNIDKPLDESNPWTDFKRHFLFVAEYYPSKNILNSPMILATMFSKRAPLYTLKLSEVKREINKLSKRIDSTFNLKQGDSIGWLSFFGAILEKAEELEPGILKKMRTKHFIEFGPGLGFAGHLYANLFKSKKIFFDLPETMQVRLLCLSELNKKYKDFSLPHEFADYKKLYKKVNSLDNFFFISTWALTETPIDIRNDFRRVIEKAKIAIIVSNPNFSSINNFEYLNKLSYQLPKHRHIISDLSFLKGSPNYLKRHELHIFISD